MPIGSDIEPDRRLWFLYAHRGWWCSNVVGKGSGWSQKRHFGAVHESVIISRDICGAGRPTASKKSVAPNSTKSISARCIVLVPV